jgi:predicted nucleic acid-binding protein
VDIYVVDTNLLFSSILNDRSRVGNFIQQSSRYGVRLCAPERMRVEILNHKSRILKLSGYTDAQFTYVRDKLYRPYVGQFYTARVYHAYAREA